MCSKPPWHCVSLRAFPQAIVWGPQLITLYNDAFTPILGNKPYALGRTFSEVWSEAWAEISPICDAAFQGHATYIENFPLVIERGQAQEQAYFTFCYSPIRDPQGAVVGMLDTGDRNHRHRIPHPAPGGARCHRSRRGQCRRCRSHHGQHHPSAGRTPAREQLRLRRHGRRRGRLHHPRQLGCPRFAEHRWALQPGSVRGRAP